MTRLLLACLPFLLALPACRTAAPPPEAPPSLRVWLVRHAETDADGTRDPGLSAAGRARAERLAARLAPAGLAAVYATEYRRTRETAAPAARAAGVEVEVVPYGAGPLEAYAQGLAGELRALLEGPHAPGAGVLVVGHSNTTPALAEALLGRPVDAIGEGTYDRVIGILLTPGGAALLP